MVTSGQDVDHWLSGHTGELAGSTPHLHFQFGGKGQRRADPFRNLSDPSSLSYWTVDNGPQYLP
jgi:murein DD-endopeptidase MepM/ murein hydrolase activator NlpD